jgi:diacylglycerol kinase (ATP)
MTEKFSIRKRAYSFTYAAEGIMRFLRSEHNAWVHLAATIMVIVLVVLYRVTTIEAVLLVFSIGFVWAAEIFNTCIERIMDFISTERHPQIQLIKDMSAGAVLVAAITALIIGLIVFVPKIF